MRTWMTIGRVILHVGTFIRRPFFNGVLTAVSFLFTRHVFFFVYIYIWIIVLFTAPCVMNRREHV